MGKEKKLRGRKEQDEGAGMENSTPIFIAQAGVGTVGYLINFVRK